MRVTYRKVATSILLVISLISLKVVFYFNQRVGYGDANLNSVNNNGGRDRSSGPVDVAIDNLPLDLRRNQRSAKSYSESLKRNEIMVNNVTEDQKDAANTPQPSTATELRHVFISVKTSKRFHQTRVKLITETWGVLAREQTFFFSDDDDAELSWQTNQHLVNTHCDAHHDRQALCCKMAQEYDLFMASRKRWFCHFDDDNYVNIPELMKLLKAHNHTDDWYLGKPSLKHPIESRDRDNPEQKIAFWFATGGAGFCISRSLALKMKPHSSGGRLMTVGEKIRLPDDCTIGYIINHVLNKQLTVIDTFHSHLESLRLIKTEYIKKQITFSYSEHGDKMNVVYISGFNETIDPTRFRSIHCHLFPYLKDCSGLIS